MMKIIKFEGSYCGPCKALTSLLGGSDLPIETIDIQKDVETTMKYNIRSVPTLVFIKDGVEVDRIVGLVSLEKIQEAYNKHV